MIFIAPMCLYNFVYNFFFSHYNPYLIEITGWIKDECVQKLHNAFGAELVVPLPATHGGKSRLQLKWGKVN